MKKELADYLNKESLKREETSGERIKKEIEKTVNDIRSEFHVLDWDYIDVEKLEPVEAFNRGIYRAYCFILGKTYPKCTAQIGISFCKLKSRHGEYCKKHAEMFLK